MALSFWNEQRSQVGDSSVVTGKSGRIRSSVGSTPVEVSTGARVHVALGVAFLSCELVWLHGGNPLTLSGTMPDRGDRIQYLRILALRGCQWELARTRLTLPGCRYCTEDCPPS